MGKRSSAESSGDATAKRPRPAPSAEAFPRGGGSSLTPLEYRAAVKSADGDVLFSSKSGTGSSIKTQANREAKRVRKDSRIGAQAQEARTRAAIGLDDAGARAGPKVVESLKYKHLTPGSKVLCAVAEVSDTGITLSLPNCLTGTVRADHMPSPLVRGAECVSVGDTLCASVIGLGKDSKDGKKNALSLSLLPSDVSSGITIDNIQPEQVVQGAVRSLEDHGAVLDIGIAGCTAFLPQKFFHHIPKPLCVGCILRVSVESVNASRAVVKCCLNSAAQPLGKPVRESDAPSIDTFMPGQLLKVKVTSVLDGGIIAVGPGGLYVTIDSFHVDYSNAEVSSSATPRAVLNTGDSVLSRLTFIDKVQHRFCASALKHLVTSTPVDYSDLQPGSVIQACVIRRIDPSVGIFLSIPDRHQFLFVHASRVGDERIEKLERVFQIAQEVPCRILGHSLIDGMALATMKPSALNEEIVHFGDLKLGSIVKGRVASVEKTGIRIALSSTSTITGFIPVIHCSDAGTQSFLKKAKVGKKMKCRIIKLESSHRRVLLTAKPSLLESDVQMFSSYEQCTPSAPVSCGFVSKIEEKFLIVAFCGDVHGIMFKKDLNLEPDDNIDENFTVGQPIKCFVSSCSARDQKLRLCLNKRESSASTSAIAIGSVHKVIISEKSDSQLTCTFDKSTGVIPKLHVCDVLSHAERAFERIEIGQSFDAVVVENSPRVLLSLKPLLLESVPSKPDTLSDLVVGRVLVGFVKNITSFGVFVSILPGLTAFASKSALSDSFVADPSKLFDIDQTVLARVDSVDLEQSRISVSLKLSAIGDQQSFLSHFFSERASLFGSDSVSFRAGTKVEAEVIACTSSGAVVDLGDLGDGLLDATQWETVPKPGSKISCVVVDYCESKECLEVCSRKQMTAAKMSEKLISSAIKKSLANKVNFEVTVEIVRKEYAIVRAPALSDALCILSNAHFNYQSCQFAVGQTIKSVSVLKNADSDCGHVFLQQSSSLVSLPKESLPSTTDKAASKALPGHIVSGKLTSIDSMQLNVRLGVGQKGRVHISEVQNPSTLDVSSRTPFRLSQFTIGEDVRVRVLQTREDGLLELSMRLSDESEVRPTLTTLKVGDRITGFAQGASSDGVWLQLAPGLRGRVHPLDAGLTSKDVLNVNHIVDGTPLSAVVVRVDISSKVIDLTLRHPSHDLKNAPSITALSLRGIFEGAVVPCKVTRVIPGAALLVSLAPHIQGRVSIIDVCDQLIADPFNAYSVGDVVDAQVSEIENSDPPIVHLSCRDSKVAPSKLQDISVRADIGSYSDLFIGQVVSGYVRTSSKSGVFVTLGRKVSARVVLRDLSDKFVSDISKSYPPGKLVQGRITAVDVSEGHASLNLKTSVLSCTKRVSMEDIVPGCIVLGKVKSTQSYGLFVSIDHSDLVGFVHISQMSGDFIKNVTQVAAVGDAVKAKVQKVENGKIWLGMKSEDISSGEIINDEGDSDEEVDNDDGDEDESESESENDDDDDDDDESSNGTDGSDADGSSDDNSDASASDDESDSGELSDNEVSESKGASGTLQPQPAVVTSTVPFSWDAFSQIASKHVEKAATSSDDSDESGESENGEDAKQSKQSRRRKARTQELDIRRQEEDLLSGAGAPSSINDFERLVVANPNSSVIWIRYMAFLLSLAEVDKARAVGERALKTIIFREESEKLNVWMSLLNLENMFGTSDTLFDKFKKACQFNDEKKVHFAFADILIRRGDDNLTLPFFKVFTRKFAQSGKAWVKLAELHLQKGRVDAFKETMERCVLAIPRRKHTKTIVKFILLEFNNGSAERGRTLMEGVLSQNPKRIDLWSVYVDMEIKVGEVERARAVLDRIITLPIKARQMKFVFKKMLDVEKKHGGPEQVEEVKRKAREYVARNMQ